MIVDQLMGGPSEMMLPEALLARPLRRELLLEALASPALHEKIFGAMLQDLLDEAKFQLGEHMQIKPEESKVASTFAEELALAAMAKGALRSLSADDIEAIGFVSSEEAAMRSWIGVARERAGLPPPPAPVELPALPEPPVPPSLPSDDPTRVVDCHVLISEEGDATVAVDESAEVKAAAEAFEAAQEAYAAAQEAYLAEMAAAAAAAAEAEAAAAEVEVEFLRVDEAVAAHLFDTLVEHVEKVRAERAAAEAAEAARLEAEQLEQVRPLSASDCHPYPVVAARAGASSECPLIASDCI
jgi:hypothetical protein